jgi:hypothetical protein
VGNVESLHAYVVLLYMLYNLGVHIKRNHAAFVNMVRTLGTLHYDCSVVFQEVLKELLVEKLPRLGAHFALHQVDAGMFSLNWFLCVFVDNIPVKTYLHIWDAFLFEGSKVTLDVWAGLRCR